MSFEQLDRRMRVFETAHDHCVLPGVHMVARIDGRSFSHLTRVAHALDAPYDARFRDCMVGAMTHVMSCGFAAIYGYTQSDEINVLFRRDEQAFGRKLRKFLSVLAGEASAAFSVAFGAPAAFDCRISQLPRDEDVVDYFRWRAEDAARNALNAHAYWLLRRQGLDDHAATVRLRGVSVSGRHELLFAHGINFAELPAWERRGIAAYPRDEHAPGVDPRTGAATVTTKRRVHVDLDLPMKDEYDAMVRAVVARQ